MHILTSLTALALATHHSLCVAAAPQALVYRGPAACDGCPEALAHLLRTAPSKFNVSYVGPKETIKLNRKSLSETDMYAQPGGGGVSVTWPHMKPHYDEVRDFISSGGLYLGTCLGAYFAGTPGFDLLGPHRNTNEESTQPGSQVNTRINTVIQVDWNFASGKLAGTTEKNRWLFFQDGAVIAPHRGVVPNATILATYSRTGDLAALVKGFGKGRIGIAGPHPEARRGWCKSFSKLGLISSYIAPPRIPNLRYKVILTANDVRHTI